MAKPTHTSRRETVMNSKEVATTKKPETHTPNKQATPTLRNPLRHSKGTEGDSNKAAMTIDTVKLRQRLVVALHIQGVQVRPAVATVRPILRTILGRELMVNSWGE